MSLSEYKPPIDEHALQSWHFPTNQSKRDYQFNIIQTCLKRNTLVVLPTGLGKTFVAAIVMYNFYRWFPKGKMMFMAPTRPLVKQQMKAVLTTVEIPLSDTTELTSQQNPSIRKQIWRDKRVFFLTPQILENDLEADVLDPRDIVLIICDEAHKAMSNYAYCQVVRLLQSRVSFDRIRMLALTATPASKKERVQEVLDNLCISTIELRDDESPDVRPFVHHRDIETIVLQESADIAQLRRMFEASVLQPSINRLVSAGVLKERDPFRISRFRLIHDRNAMRMDPRFRGNQRAIGPLEGIFGGLMSFYQGYDLLAYHGIIPFRNYISMSAEECQKFKVRLRNELDSNPGYKAMMQEMEAMMNRASFVSHPKITSLINILKQHFSGSAHFGVEKNTRVIVFSSYRQSVYEIVSRINQHGPMLRAMSFVGQSSANGSDQAVTQKQQIEVLNSFRNGGYNILVSTCIGEEGLDIGSVDLIVCYDMDSSPVRMLQRIGRTGRHRDGRIVLLLTSGREERNYQQSKSQHRQISRAIANPRASFKFYQPQEDPLIDENQWRSMMCVQREFHCISSQELQKITASGDGRSKSKTKSSLKGGALVFVNPISDATMSRTRMPALGKHLNYQRILGPSFLIAHSSASRLLCSLRDESTPGSQHEADASRSLMLQERLERAIAEMQPMVDPFYRAIPLNVYERARTAMNAVASSTQKHTNDQSQSLSADTCLDQAVEKMDEDAVSIASLDDKLDLDFVVDISEHSDLEENSADANQLKLLTKPATPSLSQDTDIVAVRRADNRKIITTSSVADTPSLDDRQFKKSRLQSRFIDCEAACSEDKQDSAAMNSFQQTDDDGSMQDFINDSSHLTQYGTATSSLTDNDRSSNESPSEDMMAFYRRTALESQAGREFFKSEPRQYAIRPNFHAVPHMSPSSWLHSSPKSNIVIPATSPNCQSTSAVQSPASISKGSSSNALPDDVTISLSDVDIPDDLDFPED